MFGKTWIEYCIDSLSEEEKDLIKYSNSENVMEEKESPCKNFSFQPR